MRTLARFGSAASALALAAMLGGCAAQLSRGTAAATPKPGDPDFALATRAHAALASNDLVSAVDLAERAVAQSPDDSAVRTLLADAYFASGRFASAEAAYRDSLSLAPAQPTAVLKLALVQIAQGRSAEALQVLNASQAMLDPTDRGLAIALAGQPTEAVAILEQAARAPGADARLRQNLALAHALAGDWEAARVVASQDLSPAMVEARVQQWMAFANPSRASDQVAALVGVTPAAVDPGQPTRLALGADESRMAAAVPVPLPAPIMPSEDPAAPLAFAEALPSVAQPERVAAPAVAEAAYVPPPVPAIVLEAASVPAVPASFETKAPQSDAAPAAAAVLAEERKAAARARPASMPRKAGDAGVVVQLGAYSSPDRISLAWDRLAERYPALREYSPMRARFDGPKGTVWRLSIKGFDSQREAIQRCEQLRSRGGNCFVRSVKGDAPIRLASR